MYVCVCHSITEKQLEKAARTTKTPREALKKLNVGKSCGTCLIYALEKIQSQASPKSKSQTVAPSIPK
ncbi:MAG: (2Fe-2S)-binding protein [Bacteriovoracaceae bacterium]